jgi:biopolymer transport protein ExbB
MTDPTPLKAAAGSSAVFSVADAVASRVADGGIVLWLLGGFSILAMAIVGVKLVQFARLQIWSRAWLAEVWRDAGGGAQALEAALSRVRSHPSPVARVVEAVLVGRVLRTPSEAELREEVERVADEQLGQLESGLRGLDSIGTLAPLLGLLGTVLGMIRAFAQMEQAGGAVDPALLSGGIWEALLTTAVGLAVAIPALAALAWLDGQVDAVRRQLGDAATRALGAQAWRTTAREASRVESVSSAREELLVPTASERQHAL